MKKFITLFFCATIAVTVSAQQGHPFSITINCAQPPITLNNIMDTQAHTTVSPVQNTEQSAIQTTEQTVTSLEKINPFLTIQSIWNFLWGKKYQITLGIAFISLASFCYYYYYMKSYLEDEKNWSAWHSGSLQNLLESTNQSVIDALLKEIQIRYYNCINPTNPIQPLVEFSIAIEKEICAIKRYLSVLTVAKKIYFHYFFSIETNRDIAEKKLSFIIFLKKQFLEWISQHNIKALCTN